MSRLPTSLLLPLGLALASCATPRLVPPLRYGVDPLVPDDPARAVAPALAPVREVLDAPARTTLLANGMRAVLYERHEFPAFAAQLVIDRGAVDLGDAGALQTSQMMYLFATEGDVTEWDRRETDASSVGTRYGSGTSSSEAWLSASGVPVGLEGALDELGRWASRSALKPEEYGRRAGEWTAMADKKVVSLDRGEKLVLFGRTHPYGYAGRGDDVIPFTGAMSLHAQLFQPAHATLVVVGDVDPARLDAAVAHAFAAWAPGTPIPRRAEAPAPVDGPHLAVIPNRGLTQTHAAVCALGPPPSSDDAAVFLVIGKVLGGGKSSRLFERLRDETGEAYGAGFGIHFERTASRVEISASYDTDKAVDGVGDVLRAIDDLRAGKVTDAELAVARDAVLADWREVMASDRGAAAAYGEWLGLGEGAERQRTLPGFIGSVRREDVIRVASKYLARRALHVVFFGEDRWLDGSPLHIDNLQRISLD